MKKAKWIICRLGDENETTRLAYTVKESGRSVELLHMSQINDLVENSSTESDLIVTRGSIWTNWNLRIAHPNWYGNFHIPELFSCTHYYPLLGEYLVQENYVFLQLSELIRKKDWLYKILGQKDTLFIRPDSSEKDFNGELVTYQCFSAWVEHLSFYKETNKLLDSTLCVISSPVKIDREVRLIIADGQIVDGSTYREIGHVKYESIEKYEGKDKLYEFAHKILPLLVPHLPLIFALDIALVEDKYKIMEIGSFNSCGLYDCNLRKIVEKISESVEKNFERASPNG